MRVQAESVRVAASVASGAVCVPASVAEEPESRQSYDQMTVLAARSQLAVQQAEAAEAAAEELVRKAEAELVAAMARVQHRLTEARARATCSKPCSQFCISTRRLPPSRGTLRRAARERPHVTRVACLRLRQMDEVATQAFAQLHAVLSTTSDKEGTASRVVSLLRLEP